LRFLGTAGPRTLLAGRSSFLDSVEAHDRLFPHDLGAVKDSPGNRNQIARLEENLHVAQSHEELARDYRVDLVGLVDVLGKEGTRWVDMAGYSVASLFELRSEGFLTSPSPDSSDIGGGESGRSCSGSEGSAASSC
jgi:hypothetical protein